MSANIEFVDQYGESLGWFVALHEMGHAVMAQSLGAIVTSVKMPLDLEAQIGGQVTWRWPFCRLPRDRDNLMITLAGPAVSLMVGDPYPLWGSREDIADAEKIVAGYASEVPAKNIVIDLLAEIFHLIQNSPSFMSRVVDEAQRFVTSYPKQHLAANISKFESCHSTACAEFA